LLLRVLVRKLKKAKDKRNRYKIILILDQRN